MNGRPRTAIIYAPCDVILLPPLDRKSIKSPICVRSPGKLTVTFSEIYRNYTFSEHKVQHKNLRHYDYKAKKKKENKGQEEKRELPCRTDFIDMKTAPNVFVSIISQITDNLKKQC